MTEMFIGYESYLFSCLLKQYNTEFEQLPYDEQFEQLPDLYERFRQSQYNQPSRGLYECIVDYLSDGNFTIESRDYEKIQC